MSFYDETHSDRWGCLTCTPFLWWPLFVKKEIRHQYKSVQVLGYVPNFKLGKGKSCRQSSISKLQEEHDFLRPLLIQLKNIVDEGGLRTQVMGRKVTVNHGFIVVVMIQQVIISYVVAMGHHRGLENVTDLTTD